MAEPFFLPVNILRRALNYYNDKTECFVTFNLIYFFIYFRVGIIKNPEAFKEAFARGSGKSGKTVKVFLLQPREL